MLKVKFGSTKLLTKLALMTEGIEVANDTALENAGEMIVAGILETLDQQMVEGPALAQTTITLKGHNLKLLETYQMRDNVTWRKDGDNTITAGVHMDAPEKRGLIAKIHEHGNDHVPRRAFIEPTWERIKHDVLKQYDIELKAAMLLMSKIT